MSKPQVLDENEPFSEIIAMLLWMERWKPTPLDYESHVSSPSSLDFTGTSWIELGFRATQLVGNG